MSRRWPDGAEARLVFGRDQFVPGGDLAQGGRGVRRGNGRLPGAGLVSRGSLRGRGGRFLGGAATSVRSSLHRPRQWGACWLVGQLWRDLQLDRFWAERLPASRKRTRWDQVLQVLVAYRLIEPGSEWRLHREWFGRSAMADLLGSDFGVPSRTRRREAGGPGQEIDVEVILRRIALAFRTVPRARGRQAPRHADPGFRRRLPGDAGGDRR